MIASKDQRIQEQTKKHFHSRKESKDLFFVNNNANNLANKEAISKQQKDNIPNGKQAQEQKGNLKNQRNESSKMKIDLENYNAKAIFDNQKNLKNNNPQNNKSNNINNFLNNFENGNCANTPENKNSNFYGASEETNAETPMAQFNPDLAQLEKEVEKKKTHKDKLNEILISNYGPEIYEFSMELEKLSFCPNNLKKHKIEPEIRTKMIDWMIEVLSAYNSDPQTFSLAVQILDMFLARTQNVLTNNDVHLVGICCMYIASKMEDIVPLRMNHVKSKISHNKFSEKEIKKKEKAILETINFETINSSTYDFIRTFIFDFIHNNRVQIYRLEMFHHIDVFDNVAVFLSKLIFHSDEFNNYK